MTIETSKLQMGNSTASSEGMQAPPITNRVQFALEGMTCASCAMRIEKGLKKVPGVLEASVNLATEQGSVTYDPTQTGVAQMVQKVEAVGYKAIPLIAPASPPVPIPEPEQADACATFDIEGMTCASCAMRIEKGLKKVAGVIDAQVNLATERATVTYDPAQTGSEQMMRSVEAIGYKARPVEVSPTAFIAEPTVVPGETSTFPAVPEEDEQQLRKKRELTRKRNLLILGIVLSLPILLLSMFFMNRFPGENLLLLVLTTPIFAIVGWEFHRGALKTLRHGSATMDTLDSAGATAAYLLSAVATFFPQIVGGVTFYDTAALIITLIFLGKYLEARRKDRPMRRSRN